MGRQRLPDLLATLGALAVALADLGLALGIAGAFALGRVIQSQLFGVNPMDPLTLAAVALVLGTTAAAASYLPADAPPGSIRPPPSARAEACRDSTLIGAANGWPAAGAEQELP